MDSSDNVHDTESSGFSYMALDLGAITTVDLFRWYRSALYSTRILGEVAA